MKTCIAYYKFFCPNTNQFLLYSYNDYNVPHIKSIASPR